MELIITIFFISIFVYSLIQKEAGKKTDLLTVILLVGVIIVQLIFRGPRWQVFLLYIYALIMSIQLISKYKGKSLKRVLKIVLSVFYITILLISLLLTIIFTYNKFPKPAGDSRVGTISFDITDSSRKELYGDTRGEARKIRVQMWYPADDILGYETEKWFADGRSVPGMIPAFTGMPQFLLKYTARIDSNSFKAAPISTEKKTYPLVIISHGWFSSRSFHADIAELLASCGYIVIGIDHTYGALATVFDTGETRFLDPSALPSGKEPEEFHKYSNTLVKTYSLDAKLVIDTLEDINKDGLFNTTLTDPDFIKNRIDMSAIGLLGHSTGGGGTTRLAMTDNRIKALFGLDSWVEPIAPELLEKGLKIPSLFINSEEWKDQKNGDFLKMIFDNSDSGTEMYRLNGTTHQDFAMIYMLDPLSQIMGLAGELKSDRRRDIQHDFILKFFDKTLRNKNNNIDDLVDSYNEMVSVY